MGRASLLAAIGLIVYFGIRLSQLKKQNERMAARLVEVDQMKKDFISHVSHELKAPLASMQETTHLMSERIPGPLTDKQRRLLDLNLQSGKRLAQMIGNILDLSRLEAGIVEYDMQAADVADLMHNVVMELSSQAREKSLRILTDIRRRDLLCLAPASGRRSRILRPGVVMGSRSSHLPNPECRLAADRVNDFKIDCGNVSQFFERLIFGNT